VAISDKDFFEFAKPGYQIATFHFGHYGNWTGHEKSFKQRWIKRSQARNISKLK